LLFSGWVYPITGVDGVKKGEWPFYGGDQGSTKYSQLDQINRDNVKNSKVAWTWDSADLKLIEQNSKLYLWDCRHAVKVGGVMYIRISKSGRRLNAHQAKTTGSISEKL